MSVPVKIYRTVTYQEGQTPSNPNLSGDPVVNPINPNGGAAEELVPYDGAIKDVNLGEKGLSTGFVQYDNTPTDTPTGAGTVVWNPDKYTLDLSMGLGDSVQQIGMETYYTPVKNQTGSLIPDGTFVMATGSLGASGRITIAPAVTDGSVDSRYMLGVTTHDIADGEDGLVTWFGEIRGFNTNTKAPVGETWVDGTVLWNNPAVAGGFTSVEPQAPNLKIPVAIVISAGNNGVIFVRPRLGMRLTDLHDVDAFTPSDKDLISYDSALGHWNAKSLGSVIGGTSSQFLKGDGSLDSNSYALASQINIASGQVAFGTGSNTIGGDSGLVWDNTTKQLLLSGGTYPVLRIERTTTVNNTIVLPYDIKSKTSVDMLASFGTGMSFTIEDNTASSIIGRLQFLRGSTDNLGIFQVVIGNGSLTPIHVDETGRLGLLTSLPTDTLDVNGTVRVRSLTAGRVTFAGTNGVLTDDAGLTWNNSTRQLFIVGNTFPAFSINRTSDSFSGIEFKSGVVSSQMYFGYRKTEDALLSLNNLNAFAGIAILNSGSVGVQTTSPTNTLDVNGTGRIRTLSNSTGDFVTASATGVLQKRTASEALTDIGAIGGTIASGQVAFGTGVNTVGGDAGLQWNNTTKQFNVTGSTYPVMRLDRTTTSINNTIINSFDIKSTTSLDMAADFGTGMTFTLQDSEATSIIGRVQFLRGSTDLVGRFQVVTGTAGTTVPIATSETGQVGILTLTPTNTLDVNGTARIRSLTGTTGYLPLLSSTGVMGQSVVYNTSAGSVLIGTINEVSGHKVRISGGALNITNWQSSAGAYDKLSIDFGENRGFGYDPTPNEIFVKGATTVPVKIDTDAPTDSLNVLSTGGIKMANIPSGTATTALGLDSNNEIVKFSNNQYKFIQTKAGVTKSTLPLGTDLTDSFNEERETMFDNAVLVGSRSFDSSVECPANSVYLIKGNVRVTTSANTPTPTFSVRMNFFGYNENALRTDFPFQGSQITTGNYLLNFEIRISFTDSPSNSMFIDMKMYKFEETGTTVEARGFVSTPSNAFSITGTSTLDILLGGNNNTVGEILLIECKKLK